MKPTSTSQSIGSSTAARTSAVQQHAPPAHLAVSGLATRHARLGAQPAVLVVPSHQRNAPWRRRRQPGIPLAVVVVVVVVVVLLLLLLLLLVLSAGLVRLLIRLVVAMEVGGVRVRVVCRPLDLSRHALHGIAPRPRIHTTALVPHANLQAWLVGLPVVSVSVWTWTHVVAVVAVPVVAVTAVVVAGIVALAVMMLGVAAPFHGSRGLQGQLGRLPQPSPCTPLVTRWLTKTTTLTTLMPTASRCHNPRLKTMRERDMPLARILMPPRTRRAGREVHKTEMG